MNALAPAPSFLAARLALLALRASIDESIPLTADRVLLDAAASPMSTDEAAQLLAAKPKPLFCDAEARDRTLVVRCRTQSEARSHESHVHEFKLRDHEKRGGLMGYLEDRYGPGDHLLAAYGRGESLLVPYSVVERWVREYETGGSYSGDDIDNPLATSEPEYVEARRNGAKGILRFSAPVTPDYFSVIALPSDGDDTLSKEAEALLVEMARWNHIVLRSLMDSPEDLTLPGSGAWKGKQVEFVKEHLMHTVTMLKQVFKGRTMPPDVAGFVEDCDKTLGQF